MDYVNVDSLGDSTIPDEFLEETEPYVALAYIMCGNASAHYLQRGMIYTPNEFPYGVTVNALHHYRECKISIAEPVLPAEEEGDENDYITSDYPTLLANWLSDDLLIVWPKAPSHDILTDLLYSTYTAMKNRDVTMAFVTFQGFLLIHRMICDRVPLIGGDHEDIEVTPYAL